MDVDKSDISSKNDRELPLKLIYYEQMFYVTTVSVRSNCMTKKKHICSLYIGYLDKGNPF